MIKFITGEDRSPIPLFVSSLEEAIEQYNQVRLIDIFVDSLNLETMALQSKKAMLLS